MSDVKIIGEENKTEGQVVKNVKIFILASGSNVISEYEERDPVAMVVGEEAMRDVYWKNPMLVDLTKLPTGQTAIVMSPLATFTKEESIGPINPLSIICSYDVGLNIINTYENQVVKLKAARSGLVQAKQMPKIGDPRMKVIKP